MKSYFRINPNFITSLDYRRLMIAHIMKVKLDLIHYVNSKNPAIRFKSDQYGEIPYIDIKSDHDILIFNSGVRIKYNYMRIRGTFNDGDSIELIHACDILDDIMLYLKSFNRFFKEDYISQLLNFRALSLFSIGQDLKPIARFRGYIKNQYGYILLLNDSEIILHSKIKNNLKENSKENFRRKIGRLLETKNDIISKLLFTGNKIIAYDDELLNSITLHGIDMSKTDTNKLFKTRLSKYGAKNGNKK